MNVIARAALTLALVVTLGAVVAAPARAQQAKEKAAAEEAEPVLAAVSFGEFLIRDFRVVEGSKLRISFKLYGATDEESAESLREFAKSHEHRIRSEVLVAIRTCEQADFQEPDLDRLRRRVMARLKRTMPSAPLEGLLVGEYEFFND